MRLGRRGTRGLGGALAVLGGVLGACGAEDALTVATGDAVCGYAEREYGVAHRFATREDLLIVVDRTVVSQQARTLIARAAADVVRAALDYGGGDSLYDLRVGVVGVTTGVAAGSCAVAEGAQLASFEACGGERVAWFQEELHDRAVFEAQVACTLDELKPQGCEVSQPLEVARLAVEADLESASPLQRGPEAQARLTIAIITAGDDCSVKDMGFFDTALDEGISRLDSCAANPDKLHDLAEYATQLPFQLYGDDAGWGVSYLVVAGFPQELAREANWMSGTQRAAFVADTLLRDPAMTATGPDAVACSRDGETARPARRLAGLAVEGIQSDHRLISLCDDSVYDQALDHFDPGIQYDAVCGTWERDVRDAEGYMPCEVIWELPTGPIPGFPTVPTRCEERPELLEALPDVGESGGARCAVRQRPVPYDADGRLLAPVGSGVAWVVADEGQCEGHIVQEYSEDAYPPVGVDIRVRCHRSYASGVPSSTSGGAQAGDRCDGIPVPGREQVAQPHVRGDAYCSGMPDDEPGLFCHPQRNLCVKACDSDGDCPDGLACSDDAEGLSAGAGQAICENPSCAPRMGG